METQGILEKLEGVTGPSTSGGRTWEARCPAHDDKDPSLSVTDAGDRTLLHCHAGCSFEAIAAAMNLEPKDFFRDNGTPKSTRSRIVATYDYEDADGELLYQVVRFEPKDFRQRRPDPDGDGWDWSVKGVKRVPYHLPEVAEADQVFICEGEKSADAVRSLGVVATCNSGGASKWTASLTDYFIGKDVIILPDEDDAGQHHASLVADTLASEANSVKIVHLPRVTTKSDPDDWIEAGGTLEDLEELVASTEEQSKSPVFWDSKSMGRPRSDDFIAALNALGYRFRMDTTEDLVEVNGEPISDVMVSRLKTDLRDYNYRQVNIAQDAWVTSAADNAYHPIQDFLASISYDGEDHIGKLAGHFASEYFEPFFRRWMIGAVARAYEPTQNRMLVLVGPQDSGKSFFVRWLATALGQRAERFFVESSIDPDSKDDLLRLIRKWIWEVAELGSTTRRSDREALKQFISKVWVTARKPYDRYDLNKPALANFIGTVNDEGSGFLDDPTGYRRYMVAVVDAIDWDYSRRVEPAQLWAQAKHLYDQGERWRLTDAERKLAKAANESFEVEEPLEYCLQAVLERTGDPEHRIHTEHVKEILHSGTDWKLSSPKAETMAIASALKAWKGVEKKKMTIHGVRAWGYTGVRVRGAGGKN